ncbi:MAG: serine hydrolase domain-containing protein [Thermomicrobiales bacterium]
MDDWQPLDAWIDARMARDGTPGLGIAITDRNETRYLGTFGFADLAAGTAVSAEHAFQNGSIGKTFTALLLLNMSEQGEVDLNAPVNQYLTWFEAGDSPDRITLLHLLTHTAGIIEGTDIACDGRFEAWALRGMPLVAEPGERFAYSNLGYKILGYVIERSWGELIRTP